MANTIFFGTSPGGKILKSIDLGVTITDMSVSFNGNPTCFVVDSSNNVYCGTDTGYIYKYSGGVWGTGISVTSYSIYTLALSGTALYVGDSYGEMYTSTDGNLTFHLTSITHAIGIGEITSIINTSTNLIVFGLTGIYNSIGSLIQSGNFTCACDITGGTIYAGSNDGHIWKTDDFGDTWTDLGIISITGAIVAICLLGSNRIGITTSIASDGFFYTDDGGNTYIVEWVPYSTNYIKSIIYLGSSRVILGGSDGHLYLSTDNGGSGTDLGQQFSQTIINCITTFSETVALPTLTIRRLLRIWRLKIPRDKNNVGIAGYYNSRIRNQNTVIEFTYGKNTRNTLGDKRIVINDISVIFMV
jgi:hypothetical protein